MSDIEDGDGSVRINLTEEEKAAARARKAAKRAAKAAALSQEAIAEAEARRARIADREEVRGIVIEFATLHVQIPLSASCSWSWQRTMQRAC